MRTWNETAAFWMPFIRNCTLFFSSKASQGQKHLKTMFLQDKLTWLLALHIKEIKSFTKSYKTNSSRWQWSSWFIEESSCNGLSTSGQGGFLQGQLVCNYLIWVFFFIYKAKPYFYIWSRRRKEKIKENLNSLFYSAIKEYSGSSKNWDASCSVM